jgi:hypothetical protein
MRRLLKETAKELDLFDSAICTFVWRVCNNMLFEEIRCTDFIWLMNLREPIPRIKKRNREDGRICYMIFELSKHIYKKNLADHWISTILEKFNIARDTYDHHHYINSNSSRANIKFASHIQTAIENGLSQG